MMSITTNSMHRMRSISFFVFTVICYANQSTVSAIVSVYVIAGQSNAEGQGEISHLEALVKDPATAEKYAHLVDENGDWAIMDNVYCRYNENERIGKLTTGFGFRTHKIGPELEFGHIIGNATDDTVLIIKTTWGGSSLAADFRPPSAGKPQHDYELIGDDGTSSSAEGLTYGHRYRQMIDLIIDTLENIETFVPDYDGSGWSLNGLVWFQGFSDVIASDKLSEYAANLIYLIIDIRDDLSAPGLPIVLGELGMQGPVANEDHESIRAVQRGVPQFPGFRSLTAFAETSSSVVLDLQDGFDFDGAGHFHYDGRADTFIDIGRSFAEAVLSLPRIEDREEGSSQTTSQVSKPKSKQKLGLSQGSNRRLLPHRRGVRGLNRR